MNVLLTGASGFLGSRIYSELAQNHTVTTLGRTPIAANHLTGDLTTQLPSLAHLFVDCVVNAAGKAHSLPRTAAERAAYTRVNVEGLARLLAALEQMPVRRVCSPQHGTGLRLLNREFAGRDKPAGRYGCVWIE